MPCRLTSVPLLAVAVVGLIAGPHPLKAQTSVDAFTSAVPQSSSPNSSQVAADVFGGYRDVRSLNASNTASVNAGKFTCSGSANFQGCTLQYDGNDSPDTFTPGALAPVDLTAGGADRFRVNTFVAQGTCNLLIQVCDDDLTPECAGLSQAGIVNGGVAVLLFSDLPGTLDVTSVTAVLVNLTPSSVPVSCSVGAVGAGGLFSDGFESNNTSYWS